MIYPLPRIQNVQVNKTKNDNNTKCWLWWDVHDVHRYYSGIPVKDPNGYQIIFHSLQQYEASKYVFSDGVKFLCMAVDACLQVEGTVPGYIFLFDMKGVKLTHLTRLSFTLLKKFFQYIQVCWSWNILKNTLRKIFCCLTRVDIQVISVSFIKEEAERSLLNMYIIKRLRMKC